MDTIISEKNLRTIYSIIVTYYPNQDQLLTLCSDLEEEKAYIIIIDNTENSYLDLTLFPKKCQIIQLRYNSGIAYAQNLGIQTALDLKAEVIIFFDQDSTFKFGFLNFLLDELKSGIPDIVAPLCIDRLSLTELPSVKIKKSGLPNPVLCKDSIEPYNVDIVISSGTMATSEVFKVAGLYEQSLFIDYIDTEWCLRCRDKGIFIRIVPSAVMYHSIGKKSIYFRPFVISIHPPIRCYYQFRNCFHLFRKPYIPFLFTLKEFFSLLINRLLLLFFVKSKLKYLNFYIQGIKDGLKGIKGLKIDRNSK